MGILTVIKKISTLGVDDSLDLKETKRALLINRLLALLALTGTVISVALGFFNVLPAFLTGFVILLTFLYYCALFLSSKGNHLFGTYLMILGGNIAITTTILLVGGDCYAQLMYLMVAGLPYLICDSKLGNKRLYLSAAVIPLWLISVSYTHSSAPVFLIDEEIKVVIRFTFILMTTSFSTFLLYNFNKLSETQVSIIEEQTKRLEEKNKKLQQYSHMISHDLKNPIANIEGFFSLLKMDLETDDEEITSYLSGIESGINQANKTIRDVITSLKDINSMEDLVNVNLNITVQEVKQNLSSIIKSSKAIIKTDFSQCPEVLFGELDMKSIFQNLISNSIKYTQSGTQPKIEILSFSDKKFNIISVKDNGLGINMKQDGAKLFDIYERIHTNNAEGTGIGLNMIKKIIELRGGKIEVESTIDVGSTFTVYIPNKIFS